MAGALFQIKPLLRLQTVALGLHNCLMAVTEHSDDVVLQKSMLGEISRWILQNEKLSAKELDKAFSLAWVTEYQSLKRGEIGSAMKGYFQNQLMPHRGSDQFDHLEATAFPELQNMDNYKYYPEHIFDKTDHSKNIFQIRDFTYEDYKQRHLA